MSESDAGFSFGANPEPIPPDFDDVDAIEVSGEPVSRSEAKKMGVATTLHNPRDGKKTSAVMRLDSLPKDISEELARKLETAWQHLKRNEIEKALTLAQEVVWEHPTLVAAKLIIARCFINRKEYEKALNILQAISETEANAETLYYTGLCQSRLGKIKDAIDTLKIARAASTDALIRKRTSELLKHLQGEQTVCPICGKKVLYDSMVDVGDQTICNNCARSRRDLDEEDDDDDEWMEDEKGGKRRRKRLRPPLTRADILIRAVFAVFVMVFLWGVLYAMSLVLPAQYAPVRRMLPDWSMLPRAQSPAELTPPPPIDLGTVSAPKTIPELSFDSPAISQAIAGVQLRHKAFIEGMERREGIYGVTIYPEPKGPYDVTPSTGEFTWTPTQEDAGKTFEVSFSAVFKTMRARDQLNQVTVSSGPVFKNIVNWRIPELGDARHFLATDLDGDDKPEVIIVSGTFWDGDVVAFSESLDGEYEQLASTKLPGRPAGIGVILAEEEKWLAVADYWNSRLRHYALRGGNLAEMAVDIDLPGRPILAGFDMVSSTSALLCRSEDGTRVFAYRQRGQLRSEKIGEWLVPDEFVWRRLLLVPGNLLDKRETRLVLLGGDAANAVYLMDIGSDAPKQLKLGIDGILLDASLGKDGKVYCLVEQEGQLYLTAFRLDDNDKLVISAPVAAGEGPALCGFAAVSLAGQKSASDLMIFSSNRIGISFPVSAEEPGATNYWQLPKPARLFGGAVVMPGDLGREPRVLYLDVDGGLWTASIDNQPASDDHKD